MKAILTAIILLSLSTGLAKAQSCTLPYTITNGTTADATQVMANFNALLACAGGFVNSGSTGQVAYYGATGTTVSGESLSALLDSSFGATQGAILFRSSTGWTELNPGTTGQVLQTQGSSANPQWAPAGGGLISVNAQTGVTYTVVSGDGAGIDTFSNTSAIAVTLPQAGTTGFASGWYVYLRNNNAGLVTVTPTTSTIGGQATWYLENGDNVLVISDGTNYQVVSQRGLVNSGRGYSLQIPDSATTGGNARGSNAVDLQTTRSSASQVASATGAIVIGRSNTSSAQDGVAIGQGNTASGSNPGNVAIGSGNSATCSVGGCEAVGLSNVASSNCSSIGVSNNCSGAYASITGYGGTDHGNAGAHVETSADNVQNLWQIERYLFVGTNSGASANRLTTNGSTAGATNVANLLNNGTAYQFHIKCVMMDRTNNTTGVTYTLDGILLRGIGASTATIGTTGTPVLGPTTISPPSTTLTVSADTTNAGLNVSFTPPAANTDAWDESCEVDATWVH